MVFAQAAETHSLVHAEYLTGIFGFVGAILGVGVGWGGMTIRLKWMERRLDDHDRKFRGYDGEATPGGETVFMRRKECGRYMSAVKDERTHQLEEVRKAAETAKQRAEESAEAMRGLQNFAIWMLTTSDAERKLPMSLAEATELVDGKAGWKH